MSRSKSTCLIQIAEGSEEVILVLCGVLESVSAFDVLFADLVYKPDVYLVCIQSVPFTVLLVVYEYSLVVEEDVRDSQLVYTCFQDLCVWFVLFCYYEFNVFLNYRCSLLYIIHPQIPILLHKQNIPFLVHLQNSQIINHQRILLPFPIQRVQIKQILGCIAADVVIICGYEYQSSKNRILPIDFFFQGRSISVVGILLYF